jgi:LmbE family N-acetylglucosaminyl deacetylase
MATTSNAADTTRRRIDRPLTAKARGGVELGCPCNTSPVTFTLVVFHAHPDDETLLTGGTIARASAEGHRVVLVTATAGEAGLAQIGGDELANTRLRELQRAAAILGCARVEVLGYPDSGIGASTSTSGRACFADVPPSDPAERLAAILADEQADVLTVYDERGGYGHPDHVQVHRAGVLAAEMAQTPVVLEATVDRRALTRAATLLARVPRMSHLLPADRFAGSYTARSELTHRGDVRSRLRQKRAALSAHASQAAGGESTRTIRLLVGLPPPLQAVVLGREWYRERGRPPSARLLDDVFASLR